MRSRFWPSPDQALLLEFCLSNERAPAIESWKEWKARVDLDDLENSCFEVMSLVYLRLVELGIADPDIGRLKGIHRYRWTQSQVAFRGKRELLATLHREGFQTLLLQGAALGPTVYPEAAARGIGDTEIVVPIAHVARAIKLLEEGGWIAQYFDPVRTVDYASGTALLHPIHGQVYLHWRFLRPEQIRTGPEEEWWQAAQAYEYEQMPARILCPADQFLHACERQTRQSSAAGPLWLADCAFIIRNSPVDWARVIDQAGKHHLSLHVRATLLYLHRHFGSAIPKQVLAGLSREPISLSDRIEYFLAGRPDAKQDDLTHKFGVAACRYLQLKNGGRGRQFLQDVPRFIRLLSRHMQTHRKEPTEG